jgi:hypothetical protein
LLWRFTGKQFVQVARSNGGDDRSVPKICVVLFDVIDC